MANLQDYKNYIQTTRFDPSLTTSITPLWAHQVPMLEFALSMPAAMLYSGTSTGKTLVILRYMEHFSGLRLIICPAKPISVYADDYATMWPDDARPFELYALDKSHGTIPEKQAIIEGLVKRKANAVVVLTYEAASEMPLHKWNLTAVACDEAHRLGSHNGTQTLRLAKMCSRVPNKLALTGTMVHDGYYKLFGIYRWLQPIVQEHPSAFPHAALFGSWDDFLDRYCRTAPKGYSRYPTGYIGGGRPLLNRIKPTCLQVLTTDVMDLPPAVRRVYSVPMLPDTAAAYASLRDEAMITVDEMADILVPHVFARALRLHQLTASGELVDTLGRIQTFDISPRVDALRGFLEELDPTEPVLIFVRFKRDIDLISAMLKKHFKETPLLLTGDVDEHQEWQAGAGRILIANAAAGSEGVRLTRARYTVRWSIPWSLRLFVQGMARTQRAGQKASTVFFIDILTEGTVDEAIYAALERKADAVDILHAELKTAHDAEMDAEELVETDPLTHGFNL